MADTILLANRALCVGLMPITGMILHTRDQYSDDVDDTFANGPVAISGVVAGSPAATVSLAVGDALVAIDGEPVEDIAQPDKGPFRDAVFDAIAAHDAKGPLMLTIARGSMTRNVAIETQPGCRALVEILSSQSQVARSDGRVIQISYSLANQLSDDGLAVAFAHELAHLVLEHRRRLGDAGIRKGVLGELGRNRRSNRQAEVEADRLSVHLLANAGFDPRIAPRFWLSKEGRRVDAGLFRSAIYPSPKARAELMSDEIAQHLNAGAEPSYPEHLLSRRNTAF